MSESISVALCTWNGTAFLGEQLRSLAAQERLPDELVVRDDASTDDTAALVRRFAETAPFPVRLTINPHNLGSTASFSAAAGDCQGEIIAFCDQDDAWLPARLNRTEEFLRAHPALDAAFCDAWIANGELHPTGERLWPRYPFMELEKQLVRDGRFYELMPFRAIVHGNTLAFRRRLLAANAYPFPDLRPVVLNHDVWITLAATFRGGIGYIDEPLILYRQHQSQQYGAHVAPLSLLARLRRASGKRAGLIHQARLSSEAICAVLEERFPDEPQRLRPFREQRRHLRVRNDLPTGWWRRLRSVTAEWKMGGYGHPGTPAPVRTAIGDIFLP